MQAKNAHKRKKVSNVFNRLLGDFPRVAANDTVSSSHLSTREHACRDLPTLCAAVYYYSFGVYLDDLTSHDAS